MNRKADVDELLVEVRKICDETPRVFGQLTTDQLNWKPGADRWSVAQCFDHLITANKPFFGIAQSVLDGKKQPNLWERVPLLPGVWGKLMIKSLDPATTRKLKAPEKLQPSTSSIGGDIVNDFVQQQTEIIDCFEATRNLNIEHIIITSPVTNLLTYSLLDAYRIIVVHEKRHILQAERVTHEAAFPK